MLHVFLCKQSEVVLHIMHILVLVLMSIYFSFDWREAFPEGLFTDSLRAQEVVPKKLRIRILLT